MCEVRLAGLARVIVLRASGRVGCSVAIAMVDVATGSPGKEGLKFLGDGQRRRMLLPLGNSCRLTGYTLFTHLSIRPSIQFLSSPDFYPTSSSGICLGFSYAKPLHYF